MPRATSCPTLLALVYQAPWSERPCGAAVLPCGSIHWQDAPVPPEDADGRPAPEPLGLPEEHAFAWERDGPAALPEGRLAPGLAAASAAPPGSHRYYTLTSPDGGCTVTISDPADAWHRLWLTESDGRRVLLLDRNNVPLQFAAAGLQFVNLPGGLLLALLGVQF